MKARKLTVRGESQWAVVLGKREVGRRVRIFGATKEQVIARAQAKLAELRQHGHAQSDLSATHRSIIVDWRERLTPGEMVAAFTAFQASRLSTRTVGECVTDYITAKTKADDRGRCAWSTEQEKPARSRLNRFVAEFGERVMGTLIPGEVEDFIRSQNASASNYHRVLRALFNHARRHRWISSNVFEEMGQAPTHDGDAKDLMRPAQFSALLKIAAGLTDAHRRSEPLLAFFVLGGLCGLRTAEIQRLTWGKVDLAAGRLELDRETTRKRGLRGRFIEMEPAAVAWLRTLAPGAASDRVVALTDKNFRDARLSIARAAKIRTWSHNILRRSFASHHLAVNEDGARTAAVLGHTDAQTTFAKCRVPATRASGLEWFALTPARVGGAENIVDFVAASA